MIAKPKKCIPVADAKKLQTDYIDVIEKVLVKEFGKQECRDFAWTIAELEEYIAYVKEMTGEADGEKLGLRFFLGKYSRANNAQTTMFVAPFKTDGSDDAPSVLRSEDTGEEIDPLNEGNSGWPPKNY